MFNALLKTKIIAFFKGMVNSGKNKNKASAGKMIAIICLLVYGFGTIAVMFGGLFMSMASPYYANGIGWLYFTFFAFFAFAFMFIGSVFTTKTQMFDAKDNELLLSMPIQPSTILASRLASVYVLNIFFEVLVAVPAGVIWCIFLPVTAIGVISFIVICALLPLLSMTLSCLFGWLLTLITNRLRNKSLLTVLFSLAFLAAYLFFYSKISVYIQALIENGVEIADKLVAAAPLFWIGNAIAGPSLLHLFFIVLICIVPFALVYLILSASFIKIATSKRGFAKKKYEQKELKTSSVKSALFRREMKRFLSCPPYIMNSGIGVIMLVALSVYMVISAPSVMGIIAEIGVESSMVTVLLAFAICFMLSMVMLTAPSISLEGKSVSVIQSLPVSTKQILDAKLKLHIYITLPSVLIASIAVWIVMKPDVLTAIFTLTLAAAYTVLSANLGLIFNLHFPKLDWLNETQAVKQGMSVMLTMLSSMAIAAIPAVLYGVFLSSIMSGWLFLLCCTVLFVAACLISYDRIVKHGTKLFEEL